MEIGWDLWGTLPRFLPQQIALKRTAATEMTVTARIKLGARDISTAEAEQLPRNRHATARNPHGSGQVGERLMLIGQTDGGRVLTLVIERTLDPTTWLIVTGWPARSLSGSSAPRS